MLRIWPHFKNYKVLLILVMCLSIKCYEDHMSSLLYEKRIRSIARGYHWGALVKGYFEFVPGKEWNCQGEGQVPIISVDLFQESLISQSSGMHYSTVNCQKNCPFVEIVLLFLIMMPFTCSSYKEYREPKSWAGNWIYKSCDSTNEKNPLIWWKVSLPPSDVLTGRGYHAPCEREVMVVIQCLNSF